MPDSSGNLLPNEPGYTAPGTGLLQTATPNLTTATGYTPSTATTEKADATTYQAKPFTVTPDQTVQKQLGDIISGDSPLMQQAATRARQEMQSKGLLNSSLAVEAGQNAVISQALPIAQQDANIYNQANTNTVNAQNAQESQNAQFKNTAALQNSQLGTNVNLQNAQSKNTSAAFGAQAANQLQLANVDNAVKVQLSTMDNQYRQLLQSSQSATTMFQQIVKNIADISQNATLSKAAKDAAITTQLNSLNEGLALQQETATKAGAQVASLNLEQFFKQPAADTGTTATPTTPAPANANNIYPGTQTATPQDGAVRAKSDGSLERYNAATKTWVPVQSNPTQPAPQSSPMRPIDQRGI